MASKADLRQEIEALCAKHGVSIPEGLERMNFVTLQAELQRLEGELSSAPSLPLGGASEPPGLTKVTPPAQEVAPEPARAEEPPEAPPPAPSPPDAPEAPEQVTDARSPRSPRYRVVRGKMLDLGGNRRKAAFEQVKVRDFVGGQKALDELIAAGSVETY